MPDAILAINAGSSSLKFALFELRPAGGMAPAFRGALEGIGTAAHLAARNPAGEVLVERRWPDGASQSHESLLGGLLEWVETHLGEDRLLAVGHRVVHGGRDFIAPALLDEAVLQALDALTPLAPLHQRHSLSPVRAILQLRPHLPQVACFDTAFHHTVPAVATRFGLPFAYEDEGVRRYGFHGLSYEFIAGRLRDIAPALAAGRMVVAHLGNGASLCAIQGGRSVDTTMGFTALDGLVMGTRCGAIDPGVLLYLMQQKAFTPHQLEDLLYRKSGLLGVSGISSDMRALLASDDPRARAAVELFVFRIARETAALAASMGGIDGFVFTAGIGEHAAEIRAAVCERLRWLGGNVAVHVIPTDEEVMIARHTLTSIERGARA